MENQAFQLPAMEVENLRTKVRGMTMQIWKQELHLGKQKLRAKGLIKRPIYIGTQNQIPMVWFEVVPSAQSYMEFARVPDPDQQVIPVIAESWLWLYMYGTGHDIEEPAKKHYLGSVLTERDTLVWHIYYDDNVTIEQGAMREGETQ